MSLSSISVPITTEQFLRVVEFLRKHRSDLDPVAAIHEAIETWLAVHERPLNITERGEAAGSERGYWWKTVFLPAGTKVRMRFKGKIYSAQVTDGGLRFDGSIVSPSEMAVSVARTARNAWNDLEVQFPGSLEWKRANSLR